MSTITIRRASDSDAQSIADFNIRMAMETEGKQLAPDTLIKGVRNMINQPNYGFYLVAEAEGILVGSLMITKEWSDWRNGLFWWIQSVYIIQAWRRKGIYSQLYAMVKALAAQEDNVCGYRLYVEKDNQTAQSTYEKLGMHATEYLMYEATTHM